MLMETETVGILTEFSPPTHTKIYEKSPKDMDGKSMLIYGAGPSTNWLSTKFVFLDYKPKDYFIKKPISDHLKSIGFNNDTFTKSIFSYEEFTKFRKAAGGKFAKDVHGNVHLVFENLPNGGSGGGLGALCQNDMLCFSAIGFQPANDLDDCVARGLERICTTLLPRKFCKWNVPTDLSLEVPPGSMPDSFMIWLDETKTISAFLNPDFYHSKNKWRFNMEKKS